MSTISIPVILVNGFLNSGKTTYIHDCLKNDYFYKKGLTLLLSFEEGEIDYDLELLKSRNTELLTYSHSEDVSTFLQNALDTFSPERVYVEMNAMIPELYETLSSLLRIDFSITLIEGTTFPLYLTNLRQFLQNMVKISHQVIFNRMSKEELEPYGNLFRVMNEKAAYLWVLPDIMKKRLVLWFRLIEMRIRLHSPMQISHPFISMPSLLLSTMPERNCICSVRSHALPNRPIPSAQGAAS